VIENPLQCESDQIRKGDAFIPLFPKVFFFYKKKDKQKQRWYPYTFNTNFMMKKRRCYIQLRGTSQSLLSGKARSISQVICLREAFPGIIPRSHFASLLKVESCWSLAAVKVNTVASGNAATQLYNIRAA
jgi:hypothetical protein